MTRGRPEETEAKQEMVQIPLRWASTANLETIYVNHLVITHAGAEFYLVFGELPMPPSLNPTEMPEFVEIMPKVRLAISPQAMKNIARVIQENLGTLPEERE